MFLKGAMKNFSRTLKSYFLLNLITDFIEFSSIYNDEFCFLCEYYCVHKVYLLDKFFPLNFIHIEYIKPSTSWEKCYSIFI